MEKLEIFEEFKPSEIKYGIVVLDAANEKIQSGEFFMDDIIHFVGYLEKPTKKDIENLREELRTDEEFGLTDLDRLVIFEASQEIVDNYLEIIKNK